MPDQRGPGIVAARLGAALLLLTGAYLVLSPFLNSMAWAAITGYATWPLFQRVRAHTQRPALAAGLFTLLVVLVVGVPVAWLLVTLATEATLVASFLQDWVAQGAPLPGWVADWPWLAERVNEYRTRAQLDPAALGDWIARFGGTFSARLVDVAQGVARNVFSFTITMVTLYVFYVDGERLLGQVRRLASALFPTAPAEFLEHVGAVVRAVVFGLLGTALVQGIMAGIGFAIFGVPSAVFFGFVTAVSSFVPMGPALMWGAAAAWLYAYASAGAAIGMVIWGVLLVSSVDNVLRPILISGPTRIPFLLVFLGVLGGLASMGLLGLFLGPVILSVLFTLLSDFPLPEAKRSGSDLHRSGPDQ